MNKQKLFSILYVVLIISLIAFMIWIVMFLKGDAKECLADPINYFQEKNDASCWTSCMKDGQLYDFSDDNVHVETTFKFDP